MNIQKALEESKNIAVVGMSANRSKTASTVPLFMKSRGYNIIPVNPFSEEIEGMKSYKSLADVEGVIDMVNVFRPSEDLYDVVKSAVERKNAKGDIKYIWAQLGIMDSKAKELAIANGIEYIENACIYVEYNNNF